MGKTNKKTVIKDGIMLILGTALMAFAINQIFVPADMVTGGVSGLAIVLAEAVSRQTEIRIPIWILNGGLNIPLFLIAFKMLGWKAMRLNLLGTLLLTLFLAVIPEKSVGLQDNLLIAIFGGALSGAGIGLVFSANASTGGTDLAAVLLTRRFRVLKVTQFLLILDGSIILAGVWMFGLETALYAVIAIYTISVVSDRVLKGLYDAMAVYVISGESRRIAGAMMSELGRGVTYIRATGGFSGEEKEMLFCVIGKRQLPQAKDIIAKTDSSAFVIVSAANEVLGEGFKNITENSI